MARKFTGKHMVLVMVLFFGTIIGVNVIMARFAVSTFGGTVVDNSYVASQRFNGWLAKARDQKALGWKSELGIDSARRVTVAATSAGYPLAGAQVTAVARHPLGRTAEMPLSFVAAGNGAYRSRESLPDGRWLVHFKLRRGNDEVRLLESLG